MTIDLSSYYSTLEKIKAFTPELVVMIPIKDGAQTIKRTLLSFLNQKGYSRRVMAIISDDNSQDNWRESSAELLKESLFSVVKTAQGSSYANRNFLLGLIRRTSSGIKAVIRLDSDDYFENSYVLRTVERQFFTSTHHLYRYSPPQSCNMLLLGNSLSRQGMREKSVNRALNSLKRESYLLERLEAMSRGYAEAELPSCNLVWSPETNLFYPPIKSAEDHFLLTDVLIKHKSYNLRIDEDELLVNYSLSGETTASNRQSRDYIRARKALFNYYRESLKKEIL